MKPRTHPLLLFLMLALFALLALSVLVRTNPGTRVPGRDYGFYLYIGEQITQGRLPYRDAWESKPPAIFYVNAIGLWIGRGSRWGVWLIEFAGLFASIWISHHLLKKLWGVWPAVGGVLLWVAGLDLTIQGGNLTEEYPLCLHFLALLLFLQWLGRPSSRSTAVLLGLAFGVSFLFRPNNAVIEAAIILTLFLVLLVRRNIQAMLTFLAWVALGALPPILLTGLYFWSQGLLRDLLEASILYNLSYSSTAITVSSPLATGFQIFGGLAWLGAIGYLLAGIQAARRAEWTPLYVLLLIGWPMAIFFSDPARRNYPHYFINWLPYLALLGGLVLHFLTLRLAPRWKGAAAPAVSAALLLAAVFFVVSGRAAEYRKALDRIAQRDSLGIEIRTRTAAYVENHTDPGDLVLFWAAAPGENYMSNRATPSPYLFYPLYVRSAISDRMSDQFLQDVMTRRPILIVDIGDHEALSLDAAERAQQIADGFAWEYPPESLAAFFDFVEQNYARETVIGGRSIYRLQESSSTE